MKASDWSGRCIAIFSRLRCFGKYIPIVNQTTITQLRRLAPTARMENWSGANRHASKPAICSMVIDKKPHIKGVILCPHAQQSQRDKQNLTDRREATAPTECEPTPFLWSWHDVVCGAQRIACQILLRRSEILLGDSQRSDVRSAQVDVAVAMRSDGQRRRRWLVA